MEELDTSETSLTVGRSSDVNGDPVLTLDGELDISNADSFRQAVETVLSDEPTRLVFDLTTLNFMDSSGIAVMVYAANKVNGIELRHPSTIIRRVVEATGLAEVLRLDPP
jgi:anti-sigma B factor antagonist